MIGGERQAAADGRTFDAGRPCYRRGDRRSGRRGRPKIRPRGEAARAASESGPGGAAGRSARALINALADLVEEDAERAGRARDARQRQADRRSRARDLPLAVEHFRYYAGWPTRSTARPSRSRRELPLLHAREPVGVVGQIIPWNFPMLMAAWKWGPALAAGCTVVIKPAEQTPLTALRLGELALEAGFPDRRDQRRHRLRRRPARRSSSIPASTRSPSPARRGRPQDQREGRRALKRVTFELGGKSPNIVFADADLDGRGRAARSTPSTSTRASPATPAPACSCTRRIRRGRRRRWPRRPKAQDRRPALDPEHRAGPAGVGRAGQDRARLHREGQGRGRRAGRRRRARDGERATSSSRRSSRDVDDDMAIARDEIFGPVLVVLPSDDDRGDRAARERHGLRPGGRRLDPQTSAPRTGWPRMLRRARST